MSTKIGRIPFHIRLCEVATKEYGVVITSPVMRSSWSAHTSAMVPLLNNESPGRQPAAQRRLEPLGGTARRW
jgi:hypothetical protein